MRVAREMKERLYGVRLDTPASRRGDFYRIFEEVRWELDLRGFKDVKLFASGGLDEDEVARLRPIVDAFGVGTCISNAPVVDFAMDIMEIEGEAIAKRGKWSGAKDVIKCSSCNERRIIPLGAEIGACACGGGFTSLFHPLVTEGRIVAELEKPKEIRERALQLIKGLAL